MALQVLQCPPFLEKGSKQHSKLTRFEAFEK